jgi:hypothetical protein
MRFPLRRCFQPAPLVLISLPKGRGQRSSVSERPAKYWFIHFRTPKAAQDDCPYIREGPYILLVRLRSALQEMCHSL